MSQAILAPRTALFLPASNPRAIEKARGLAVDMVILDLEDAVKEADKEGARDAACVAAATYPGKLVGIRANAKDSDHWKDDLKAIRESEADYVVVPKVEAPDAITWAAYYSKKPVLAMIETPAGVMNVAQLASTQSWGVELAGLIMGTNDLAVGLKLPPAAGRAPMHLCFQLAILSARARDIWVLDGVFNALDDAAGFEAECVEGRNLGFDGKTLIHPNQVEMASRVYSPNEQDIAEAEALIAASTGGAERYRDRMIEEMHVDAAKALLARAAR